MAGQLHVIDWPLSPEVVKDIDDNFSELFRAVFNAERDLGPDGVLSVERGGTGMSEYVVGDLLVATDTDELGVITAVAKGQVFISQGAGVVPAWLAAGTSGYFLKSQGAGSDPAWAQVTHTLLDGTLHTDTLAGTVVRGDIIIGNSTPKWSRLARGAGGTYVRSDGTDVGWSTIADSDIVDLGRFGVLADNESATGAWTFSNGLRVNSGLGVGAAIPSNYVNILLTSGAGQYVVEIRQGTATANNSFGLLLSAGTSSSDDALRVREITGLTDIFKIRGDGAVGWGTAPLTFIATSASVLTSVTAHNLLSATHGDTTAAAVSRGSLITGQGVSPTWAELVVGGAGTVLRSDGTDLLYSTFTIPDTYNQGDILYASTASVLSALAKDASATRYLSNTGASNNPAWAQVALATGVSGTLPNANLTGNALLDGTVHTDTTAGTVARGDVITGQGASAKWLRLAKGTANQVLSMDGTATDVVWATSAAAAHAILDGSTHSDSVAAAVSRGSLIYGNATPAWAELTIGADNTVLISNGTDVSWSSSPQVLALDVIGGSGQSQIKFQNDTSGYTAGDGGLMYFDGTNMRFQLSEAGTLSLWTSNSERVTIAAAGGVRMWAFGAGTATFDANGNISSVSDERQKDNITDYTGGIAQLRHITPIRFRWKPISGMDRGRLYTGFGAQQTQPWLPDAIDCQRGTGGTGQLSFNPVVVVAALVNAVKELEGRIDVLTPPGLLDKLRSPDVEAVLDHLAAIGFDPDLVEPDP